MNTIPCLEDYKSKYPESTRKKPKALGWIEVPVKKIIGGNPYRSKEYGSDWVMKRPDTRMESLEKGIQAKCFKNDTLDKERVAIFLSKLSQM